MEEDGEREVLGNQVRANVATVQLDYLSIGLVREQHLSHSRDEEWEDDSAEKQGGQRDSVDRPVARLPLFRIRILLFVVLHSSHLQYRDEHVDRLDSQKRD